MATLDQLMQPYAEAESLADAEHALRRLAEAGDAPADVLGDCFDDLAEWAANERDFAAAVRLERRAVELGCRHRDIAREMLAWYLLVAGGVEEGESLFAQLRAESPDDVSLPIALGHARSEAGMQDAALAAFDEAVAVAKRLRDPEVLAQARIERREEREAAGLPADDDDRIAPPPRPIADEPILWSLAWFPPDQRTAALERWPALADDFADPVAYARHLESRLAALQNMTGRRPTLAPIDVDGLAAWSAAEGLEPDSGAARSRYAAHVAAQGRSTAWPPGRNDPCWCGSGRKYKRCCKNR